MDKIKNYIILALFIIIGVLLSIKSCNAPNEPKTVLKHDTLVKSDTIFPKPIIIAGKTKWYPKWDTSIVYIDSNKFGSDICKFERIYNDSISDSNLTIYTHNNIIGILKCSKTDYKLKIPVQINTDRYIYNTVVVPPMWDLYIGGEVGGSANSFNTSLSTGIIIKNTQYGIRYGLLDRSIGLSIGYIILKSKK